MIQVGIGVLIHELFSDNKAGQVAWQKAVGKRIIEAELLEEEDTGERFLSYDGAKIDSLILHLEGDLWIHFFDDGQSCCEQRYMVTDDDLNHMKGAILQDIEVRDGPPVDSDHDGDYGDSHEQQFLEIITSKGNFTFTNHNVHNGYYGGFCLCLEEITKK